MSDQIQLKRSSTTGAVPTTAQLLQGELAVNTADGKVFAENDTASGIFTWSNDAAAAITGGTINGATVGATTEASGRFTTIEGTSTTASTSSTTGALIVAGGAGIAKDSYINSVRVGRGAAGNNITVVGVNTGSQLTSAADSCTSVGYQAGFWNSSGDGNTSLGQNCLLNTRTGSWNSGLGINCIYSNQSGSHNSSLGLEGLYSITHSYNTSVGSTAGYALTGSGSQYNVVIGYAAARYHSNGTTALTTADSCVYIGSQVRGLNNSDSNSIVIGASAIGDGANTTVLGTSSTTQTKLHGTATSVGIISGDRLRVINAKTPSSATDTGTAGDICWDASYLYVCTATNTWRRVAHATW
jgi:hypothetical protein